MGSSRVSNRYFCATSAFVLLQHAKPKLVGKSTENSSRFPEGHVSAITATGTYTASRGPRPPIIPYETIEEHLRAIAEVQRCISEVAEKFEANDIFQGDGRRPEVGVPLGPDWKPSVGIWWTDDGRRSFGLDVLVCSDEGLEFQIAITLDENLDFLKSGEAPDNSHVAA